jgi:hypothetical protein
VLVLRSADPVRFIVRTVYTPGIGDVDNGPEIRIKNTEFVEAAIP